MNFTVFPISNNSNCLIIGSNRGLGFEICKQLLSNNIRTYATIRSNKKHIENLTDSSSSSSSSSSNSNLNIITGIDLEDEEAGLKIIQQLPENLQIDYLIIVAGYFTTETFDILNYSEQRKMMEICAFAPLRIIQNLVKSGHLASGSKIGMITSEGGSIGLRTEAEGGGNYGHHMSKCAQVSLLFYYL